MTDTEAQDAHDEVARLLSPASLAFLRQRIAQRQAAQQGQGQVATAAAVPVAVKSAAVPAAAADSQDGTSTATPAAVTSTAATVEVRERSTQADPLAVSPSAAEEMSSFLVNEQGDTTHHPLPLFALPSCIGRRSCQ